ncbi:MAG: TetR/AcrR family transcriptional regulator [Mangrovibacterium sp.]
MTAQDKEELVREEILKQARKLFQQYGLKKTTMDEIAGSCGKAKSTLYHYFRHKEEIFEAVIQLEIISLRNDIKKEVDKQQGMQNKLMTYAREYCKEIIKRANLNRFITREKAMEARARKYFLKMMDYEQSYIASILQAGYDAGELRGTKTEDIPWIAETLLASFYGTTLFIIEKEGYFDEEKIFRAIRYYVPKLMG